MAEKQCSKCGCVKSLSEFYSVKRKNGSLYFELKCKACRIKENQTPEALAYHRERMRKRRAIPGARKEERRRYYERQGKRYRSAEELRKDRRLRKYERQYERQYDTLAKRNAKQAWRYWLDVKAPIWWLREYHKQNNSMKTSRLSAAEVYRIRYRHDPEFALRERIRRQINKQRKKDGIGDLMRSSLVRGGRSLTLERLLGYSAAELKQHLERQFRKGMNWDLFANGKIHIDHIVPQAAFNLSDPAEWRACWALSNLQPLFASDNLKKSNKIEKFI